jgi:hypothetical protein
MEKEMFINLSYFNCYICQTLENKPDIVSPVYRLIINYAMPVTNEHIFYNVFKRAIVFLIVQNIKGM